MKIQFANAISPVQRPEWFKFWFDTTYYHKLYAHRDDRQAADFIDELVDQLQPPPGSTMLDLGCGNGRHSKHLASKGFDVTGIDLAQQSIRQAKRFETPSLRFFRRDMRLPFGRSQFRHIFSFFTSFGYFSEAEHDRIIGNVAEALASGGTFVIDYLNTSYSEARLVPSEQQEIDGVVYRISRWTDKRHFYKRIAIEDNGEPLEYTEQVARFTAAELSALLARHGLIPGEIYGDYQLSSYSDTSSPRLIIVARKRSA